MNEWPLVEADMHSEYGLDIAEHLHSKPWRWFAVRIVGLVSTDRTRLCAHFRALEKKKETQS